MYTNPVGFSPSAMPQLADLDAIHHEDRASAPYIPTPPKLAGSSALRLIAAKECSQKLGDDLLNIMTTRLSQSKDLIRSISAEQVAKLRESAERVRSSDVWSTLKKLATCLLSAFSTVIGISILATGGSAMIGGAMLASGILSIANFAMCETHSWDWVAKQLTEKIEDQKKLAIFLPAAVGIACGAVGIAGAGWQIATNSSLFMTKIMSIAQASLSIFDAATTFGKGQADARLLWTQADLSDIKGKMTIEEAECEALLKGIEGCLSSSRAASTAAGRAVQKIIQTNNSLLTSV